MLGARLVNALDQSGVMTLEQAATLNYGALKQIPNVGKKTIRMLLDVFTVYKLESKLERDVLDRAIKLGRS